MSEQLIIALIVSAVVPTVLVLINNYNTRKQKRDDTDARKQEKLDDYKRADEIEERRKRESDQVASLLKTNTAAIVETTGETQGQLRQIHALVNSNLTSEMEDRLTFMQAGLASLIEIVELRKTMGHPESDGARAQIGFMRDAIAKLQATILTRYQVTEAATVEKKVTESATKAAVAALTASGPLAVKIEQDDTNPVPVKPVEPPVANQTK